MKTEFEIIEWIMSYGKTPRGRGSWAFATERNADIYDVKLSPSMTYSEAKKWAKQVFPDAPVIYVLP